MNPPPPDRTRRRLLGIGLAGAAVLAISPGTVFARRAGLERTLSFHHLHTGERSVLTYYAGGRYEPEALGAINHLLRDFRTGEVHPIAPGLLNLLHALRTDLATRAPFEVISGFRSPKTNAALRQASTGVAVRSLHMEGMAIDVRVPGRALSQVRAAALARRLGGVGYYPSDGFVHVDIGRVRHW